jgi:hypothetical protein
LHLWKIYFFLLHLHSYTSFKDLRNLGIISMYDTNSSSHSTPNFNQLMFFTFEHLCLILLDNFYLFFNETCLFFHSSVKWLMFALANKLDMSSQCQDSQHVHT